MLDTKWRCVCLTFAKTPIVRYATWRPCSEEDSRVRLETDGTEPKVHESAEAFDVFMFVPWFDDETIAQSDWDHLTEWCHMAQKEILRVKPQAIFHPSFH